MKKSMRIVSLLLCTVMLLTLLGGCGKKKEDDRRATNEIVVGISQDLDESLDPHTLTSAGGRELLFNVFEGLVKPTPAGELECAVASKYELSPDGLTYTFTLRDGITFHNGKAVTMDDVVYSIERCRDENLVAGLEQIVGLDHTDDTLTITLPKPNAEFLSCLTLAIIPQDYADQATAPVGTGPFRFVSRTAQQSIVLERFADYWGEGAKLDRVTYRIFENPDALVMALKGGAVDLYAHLPSNYASQLTEGFQIIEGTMNLVQAVYLNNAVEPLNNEKVRQALCYAINREEIFNMTADGRGAALGSSMYPAFRKYFRDDLTNYYTQDTAKAKELLAEAGYPNGFDLTITVPSNYPQHVETAQVVAEQFRAIGVNVTINPVEWATWLSDVYTNREYQATVVGVDASTMTARAMLERFTSTAHNNFTNYSNPAYDAAFEEALAATNDDVQTRAYLDMEQILTETAANVYIQDLADLVALRDGLTGYEFYPLYAMDMSKVGYTD